MASITIQKDIDLMDVLRQAVRRGMFAAFEVARNAITNKHEESIDDLIEEQVKVVYREIAEQHWPR